MAILIRRSAQAPLFEAELSRRDLNFRLIGGKRTADKKAARDLFAYMQVVASDRNEIAFRRAISTPSRGIGAATIERLRGLAEAKACGIASVPSDAVVSMAPGVKRSTPFSGASARHARRWRGERPQGVLRACSTPATTTGACAKRSRRKNRAAARRPGARWTSSRAAVGRLTREPRQTQRLREPHDACERPR